MAGPSSEIGLYIEPEPVVLQPKCSNNSASRNP